MQLGVTICFGFQVLLVFPLKFSHLLHILELEKLVKPNLMSHMWKLVSRSYSPSSTVQFLLNLQQFRVGCSNHPIIRNSKWRIHGQFSNKMKYAIRLLQCFWDEIQGLVLSICLSFYCVKWFVQEERGIEEKKSEVRYVGVKCLLFLTYGHLDLALIFYCIVRVWDRNIATLVNTDPISKTR